MAISFEDVVEQVRDANPIEEIMEESGVHLRGHGRLRTGTKHDSLKVRTDMQRAFWYAQNWNGDVFAWIMREKGCEFSEALEYLARRAHIELPRVAREVNQSEVKRVRATADVFSVAAGVFHRWLVGDKDKEIFPDPDALAYAHGRAWTDETINSSMLGFSGRKSAEQLKDMRGEFSLYGIDPMAPAAVAILGFEGDMAGWAAKYELKDEAREEGWLEKGRIHGLMDTPGLIYAHQWRGGINYLSRRQLPGFDKIKSKGPGDKDREWKSFNPNKALVGPKQIYVNHAHRMDRYLIGVEGQGDAVSFGQLGFGAVAFCGLLGEIAFMAPEDAERLRKVAAWINKHPAVYLFLDADEAGQKAIKQAAKLLGMKVQIGKMIRTWSREDAEEAVTNEASNGE